MAWLGLFVIDKLVGNRVSEASEIEGLDEGEMGLLGYAAEAGHPAPPEVATTSRAAAPGE
jgi:ammonia channel protein AmtB